MKVNLPITSHEHKLAESDTIISTTDLKGQITYANKVFLQISGFSEDELIGQSHNVVRHPDMPVAAFEDLWQTLKRGETWQGIVKNRCKNGDFYWVKAFVSPVIIHGEHVGYQSVRSQATDAEIKSADRLYKKLNQQRAKNFLNSLKSKI